MSWVGARNGRRRAARFPTLTDRYDAGGPGPYIPPEADTTSTQHYRPRMPTIYQEGITVEEEAIDTIGHVNNREYLRWMQDVATAHSAEQGWPSDRYFDEGATWVVRSHFVEYFRPAVLGDEVTGYTWVHSMGTTSSLRRYLFRRPLDATLLARAETLWVFVDLRSGRPRRIPEELRDAFPLVDDPDVAAAVGAGYGSAGKGGAR